MIRSAKALLLVVSMGAVCLAQTQPKTAAAAPSPAADNKSDAYYHFAMGRLYAEMGQAEGNRSEINKAIQHYEEALKLDPNASIIFEELSDLYIAANRLQDAITQAENQLKQNPDNLGARRMLAHVYMRAISNGQNGINEDALRKALDQYQKIVQKDPKDAESWVMLGRLNGYLHNTPEAEKSFNQALQIEADNEDALVGLAELYGQLGDSKRAAEKLKAAVDKHPSPKTLAALASAYEDLEDYKDAADAFRRALEAGSEDDRIPPALAKNLLFSGQLDEALKLYQQLAAQNPRDPETQLHLCEIYLAKHDVVKARGAIDRAKVAAGNNPRVRFAEIAVLEAEEKNDQAIAAMKSILDDTAKKTYTDEEVKNRELFLDRLALLYVKTEKMPQLNDVIAEMRAVTKTKPSTEIQLQIAQLYEKVKRYDDMSKALDEAEKLAASNEDKMNVYFSRGAMYEHQKKFDAAEAEFKKVLALNPESSGALNYLGYMLADRNVRLDEAYQMVKKAVDLEPENYAYMDSLAWVYYRQGKLDDAEGLLVRALEQTKDPTVHDHLGDVYSKEGKTREAATQWQAALKEYNAGSQADADPEEMAKVTQKLQNAQAQLAKHQ
jgi:tetratricopeptide (TPR) repeat protein